ncbi:hypothetical protein [Clostridium sp. CCUG 7971]|uniref:hypothetical protein n=1 Tax=Clostridium sp. CCUG 7971 TaxID=2811414 RepID=UPI001ABAE89C|nr:hypothetical protein [Clostridium sp. CCUG 7971]MBO3445584.1 hypothetical protein [Clostridium sp. CCUG 7971]
MLNNMNLEYKEKIKKFNEITKNKLNKSYKTMEDFINSENYYRYIHEDKIFNDEELQFFNELNLLEIYKYLAVEQVKSYEDINILETVEKDIKAYGLSGKAKEIAKKRYEILDKRFKQIKEDGDYKSLFFLGSPYRTYSLLFQDILSECIYEIMILVVLITSYLINYEFDNKTSLLVYSTKRGRNNDRDKLAVCLLSSFIISLIILGVTLLAYFITFDYSNILNIPLNSAFNWENIMPIINIFGHTFINQLMLSILIVIVCMLIFTAITFVISKLLKNSYIVFFIFLIIFGINLSVSTFVSKSSPIIMHLGYDVFNLAIRPGSWFTSKIPFIANKYYELITIVVWGCMCMLSLMFVIKRFKKEDIN